MCNLYFALFTLYYISSAIQPSSTSAMLLLLCIIISIFYALKVVAYTKLPLYFKGLNVFLLLLTIYGIVLAVTHGPIQIKATGDLINSNTNIRFLLGSILPVYPCYYFSRKGQLTQHNLRFWAIIFLITCSISFYYAQIHHIQDALQANIRLEEAVDFTNNVGYSFLLLLPIITVLKKTKVKYFCFMAICIFFILSSAKRGAILIGLFVSAYLIYIYFKKLKLSRSKKFLAYFIMIAMLVGAAIWSINYIASSNYLSGRFMSLREGDSSGREHILNYFLGNYYDNFSIIQQLFGGGADNTIISGPNYAHNDWVEILINEGIFGVICYIYYWVCFYKTYRQYKKCTYGYVIGICIFILFSKSIFSMSYNGMNLYICSILGYCMAVSQKQYFMTHTTRHHPRKSTDYATIHVPALQNES